MLTHVVVVVFALVGISILLLLVVVVVVWILPFTLATATVLWNTTTKRKRRTKQRNNDDTDSFPNSALYAGRVWHTRFRPVRHAFQYPLFVFAMDVTEMETNNNEDDDNDDIHFTEAWSREMWPLSWIVSFHESDHLRNGEGRRTITNSPPQQRFSDRVFRFVAEKTNGSFRPDSTSHRLLLITQARYYGYCFNPVSFYYLQDRRHSSSAHQKIDAVVAEVSNTPWNEMHCYVLHPDSIDQVQCSCCCYDDHEKQPYQKKVRYIFPKRFHVSPFMEMQYDYDWTFWNIPLSNTTTTTDESHHHHPTLRIINNLQRRRPQPASSGSQTEEIQSAAAAEEEDETATDSLLQFSAKLVAEHRYSMHPYRIAWHMSLFPMQCMLIQMYIHYEAFRLFVWKRVPFQPHPHGSETMASRIIAKCMTPFLAMQRHQERNRERKPTAELQLHEKKKE